MIKKILFSSFALSLFNVDCSAVSEPRVEDSPVHSGSSYYVSDHKEDESFGGCPSPTEQDKRVFDAIAGLRDNIMSTPALFFLYGALLGKPGCSASQLLEKVRGAILYSIPQMSTGDLEEMLEEYSDIHKDHQDRTTFKKQIAEATLNRMHSLVSEVSFNLVDLWIKLFDSVGNKNLNVFVSHFLFRHLGDRFFYWFLAAGARDLSSFKGAALKHLYDSIQKHFDKFSPDELKAFILADHFYTAGLFQEYPDLKAGVDKWILRLSPAKSSQRRNRRCVTSRIVNKGYC